MLSDERFGTLLAYKEDERKEATAQRAHEEKGRTHENVEEAVQRGHEAKMQVDKSVEAEKQRKHELVLVSLCCITPFQCIENRTYACISFTHIMGFRRR